MPTFLQINQIELVFKTGQVGFNRFETSLEFFLTCANEIWSDPSQKIRYLLFQNIFWRTDYLFNQCQIIIKNTNREACPSWTWYWYSLRYWKIVKIPVGKHVPGELGINIFFKIFKDGKNNTRREACPSRTWYWYSLRYLKIAKIIPVGKHVPRELGIDIL